MIGVSALEAVRECAKMGMVVLPYIDADPVLARHCEDAGAAADDPVSMAKAFDFAVRGDQGERAGSGLQELGQKDIGVRPFQGQRGVLIGLALVPALICVSTSPRV